MTWLLHVYTDLVTTCIQRLGYYMYTMTWLLHVLVTTCIQQLGYYMYTTTWLLHVSLPFQTQLLNTVISDMCNLAGVTSCNQGVELVTQSLTACNFLPISIPQFTGKY